jgi:nitrogen fixation/metabolism regulation signal transduction histidine kinase
MKEQSDFLGQVLEAVPAAIFVLDDTAIVARFNQAVIRELQVEPARDAGPGFGDLVRCAGAAQAGCGHGSACGDCEIRASIVAAIGGASTLGLQVEKSWRSAQGERERCLRVSAVPLRADGARRVVLTVDDVSELVQLRGCLPICSHCKKIRDSDDYWASVEQYVQQHSRAKFSHAICDSCLDELYPEDD